MNIEEIVGFLNSAKKLLETKLVSTDRTDIAYAFAFIMIAVGERANEVISRIEDYVIKNKEVMSKILALTKTDYTPEDLDNDDHCKRLFRTSFNRTSIGKGLMLLNTIRNKTKHRFNDLSEEDQRQYYHLNYMALKILAFLEDIRKLVREPKEAHEIVLLICTNDKISLDFAEINNVKKLLNPKIKSKSTLNFEEQRTKILRKLERAAKVEVKLKYFHASLEAQRTKDNLASLYGATMCLTIIGESATNLVAFRKNVDKFHSSHRDELFKYNPTLGVLSGIATRLTHMSSSVPNFKKTSDTSKKVLEDMVKLNQLHHAIKSLAIPKPAEAKSLQESKAEEPSKKRKEKSSEAELIPQAGSPIFKPAPKEKNSVESAKRQKEEKPKDPNAALAATKGKTTETARPVKK